MAKADKYNFADAEVDYRAGSMSVNAIAAKHSIPEPTLRREAKKRGWVKGLSTTKRAMVRDAMAGADLTNSMTSDDVRQNQLTEAQQDVKDMNDGLSVARSCINALMVMIPMAENAREIKSIVEANKGAVETIRKIRGLDDLPTEQNDDPLSALISAVSGSSVPVVK